MKWLLFFFLKSVQGVSGPVQQRKEHFIEYGDFIPDFHSFQESLLRPLPIHLRINGLKGSPGSVVSGLIKSGIDLEEVPGGEGTLFHSPNLKSPGNLMAYFLGHIHPQALTSCLASLVLRPKKDSSVLDLCAAPGGKTTHLAQLMGNSGIIVANELHTSRHVPLGHTLYRLGVLNAAVTAYQAQEFPLKQRFDFVLADVPCSGEGRFRAIKKGASYRQGRGRSKLPDLQKRIIHRAFDLLDDKGVMLYSTCTYNPHENEAVVTDLLRKREAELLPIQVLCDPMPGLLEWKGTHYDKHMERAVRFYPHQVDSVGFFMARIGRRG
jgi:NOL1/NOP2/sun family putative RNA methylase